MTKNLDSKQTRKYLSDDLYYIKISSHLEDGTSEESREKPSVGEIVRYVARRGVFVRPNDSDNGPARFQFLEVDSEDNSCAYVAAFAGVPGVNLEYEYRAEPYKPQTFVSQRWSKIARMRAEGKDPVEWQHLIPLHSRPVTDFSDPIKATFVCLRGSKVFQVEIIARR